MNIPKKNWLQKLFCRHDYRWFEKPSKSPFVPISGESRIRVCTKCGKQQGELFAEYEGNGFR